MNGYFEAIMQIRPADSKILNYIRNQVRDSGKVSITQEILLKKGDGIDIYISSWRFAITLARNIKKIFSCREVKISRKLFTLNKVISKRVYRVTILIRK